MKLKKKLRVNLKVFQVIKSYIILKFYYKLTHIEHFWCNGKFYTCKNCTYTIKGLKEIVFTILKNGKYSKI